MNRDRTVLITGATSGLGLAMARAFSQIRNWRLVLAVRDLEAGQALCRELGPQCRAVEVDMADSRSVARLASGWDGPLHGLVNNAGGQFHGPTRFSSDGVEMTLALNTLGPLQLTLGLLGPLAGGTVLNIGSGTHDPHDRGARMFGFRGGRFTSVMQLAAGDGDPAAGRQAALDRYATSKLLLMTLTVALARRHPHVRFMNLDPGLMPGTGLARTAPWPVRVAWSSVLRWIAPLLAGASTPERSAAAALRLIADTAFSTGGTYGPDTMPEPVWDKVTDPAFGEEVLGQSLAFLEALRPSPALRAAG